MKTGEIKWTQPFPGETLCNAVALADDKIINAFGKGHYDGSYQVEMIKATPERYIQLGQFNSKANVYSSPAIAGGNLFLRLEDGVACYGLLKHWPESSPDHISLSSIGKDDLKLSSMR